MDGTISRRHKLGSRFAHVVHFTSAFYSWANLTNGELLDSAKEAGYEVLITTDQSMRYQQNLSGRQIGIVVLLHPRWPLVRLCTAEIRAAIYAVQPGEVREVPIPVKGAAFS